MLRNYLLLTLVMALLSASLSAQSLSEFQFGIQLSPTFSSLRTDDNFINRDGTNLGLKLGLVGEYFFQENYSIHTGISLQFNSGGTLFYEDQFERADIWRESLDRQLTSLPDSSAGGIGYKYDLQFIEIPLGLTLRTRQFGYVRYWVRPALTLGIGSGSNGSVKGANFIDDDESFDIKDEVNSFNLSWGLGGGVEYAVSTSTAIFAGLTFQSGFTDVTDNGGTLRRRGREPRGDDSKASMNILVINLGVMF